MKTLSTAAIMAALATAAHAGPVSYNSASVLNPQRGADQPRHAGRHARDVLRGHCSRTAAERHVHQRHARRRVRGDRQRAAVACRASRQR